MQRGSAQDQAAPLHAGEKAAAEEAEQILAPDVCSSEHMGPYESPAGSRRTSHESRRMSHDPDEVHQGPTPDEAFSFAVDNLALLQLRSLDSFDLRGAGLDVSRFKMAETPAHRPALSNICEEAVSKCPQFTVTQYNILADYLGNNTEPWFLYTVSGLDGERKDLRATIFSRLYQKNPDGSFAYLGWPSYAAGLLTEEEIASVEAYDRKCFAWDGRRDKLLKTITKTDADLISLVELDHYADWAQPKLDALGYDSIFHKRPRPSSHDGCGVFWRRSKFDLVASDAMDFVDSFKEEDSGERVPLRDRCALLALLKYVGDDAPDAEDPSYQWWNGHVLIVSTHLARNPESATQDALRAKQAAQLLGFLVQFDRSQPLVRGAAFIVAGDLNATNFSRLWATASAMAVSLSQNYSVSSHPIPEEMANCEPVRPGSSSDHPARCAAHGAHDDHDSGTTETGMAARTSELLLNWRDVKTGLTSITTDRHVRIDALMYKSCQLQVTAVATQPHVPGPIPDEKNPSDHLPISAQFRVLRSAEVTNVQRSRSVGNALQSWDEELQPLKEPTYSSFSDLKAIAHGDEGRKFVIRNDSSVADQGQSSGGALQASESQQGECSEDALLRFGSVSF